jgi:PTS system mannose-specific IIA component
MIGVLVVTHGGLADELVAAARVIAGGSADDGIRALSLDWRIGLEEARERIAKEVRETDRGEGVLVLTDMFGDTPSRAALALCRAGAIEVVSGVNLPMVVRLGCSRSSAAPIGEVARWLEVKGRRSIARATGSAEQAKPEPECDDD